MFGKPRKGVREELESSGTRAVATVTEVAKSGVSIQSGGNITTAEMSLKLTLSIQPPFGASAFEHRCRLRFSQFSMPSVGDRISIIYDPDDLDRIMVDPSAPNLGGLDLNALIEQVTAARTASTVMPTEAADPLDRLAKAAALHQQGILTDAEFAEQKARILGAG